jgi:hypothetical protein
MNGNAQRPLKTYELKASARMSLKPAGDPPPAPGENAPAGDPPATDRSAQKDIILRVVEALKDL